MEEKISLLDVVALTEDIPAHNLHRGEIGTVVECYANDAYEVEFVAQDGHTYALLPLQGSQLIALREKPVHDAEELAPLKA